MPDIALGFNPAAVPVNAIDPAAQAAAAAMATARAAAARALVDAAGLELFGTFVLGGEEFALPALAIREVVAYPDRVTRMPLSPGYLDGIFTLRGTAIPVVNLARIFDPAAPASHAGQKVAILDHDDVQVGLVFDATGEVMRVRPEQRSTVSYRDTGAGSGSGTSAVIGGTISLADGARLLQVLTPSALVRIDNVPQVRSMAAATRAAERTRFLRHAEARKCLCFTAGGIAFALPMAAVQEIIRVPELKTSVMLGGLCRGWINFRGRATGVVDFATLMQCPPGDGADGARRILVVRIGDELLGLMVDTVDTIVPYFDSELLPIPLLGTQRGAMFRGCLPRGDAADTLFLDHDRIFASAELVELCAGHRRIYQDEAEREVEREAGRNAHHAAAARRQVYLAFGLGSPWATDIRQVREIVPCPERMTRPPGTADCVHGMLNLRQKMISVIDLRRLYGMPPLDDPADRRILVLERGEERYGVIVDRVDSIVHLPDSARRPSPKLMRAQGGAPDMRSDVNEVLEVAEGEVLSLFDREVFFERLAVALG